MEVDILTHQMPCVKGRRAPVIGCGEWTDCLQSSDSTGRAD